MNNKISIIVPAYNVEPYIGRCLDSILNQTYKNIEIIVVNDGSTDNTASILNNYELKDDRIRIIHKENGGVSSARLKGIEQSTGDWIGFVDGDDTIDSDMYEFLLKNAFDYNADISHCGYTIISNSGKSKKIYGTGNILIQDTVKGLTDLIKGELIEPGLCNKLYRKNLFSKILNYDIIDLSIKINEDLLMNFYLFMNSKKAIYQDKCPYNYQIREGSAVTSRLNEHKLSDPIKVTKIMLEETINNKQVYDCCKSRLIHQLVSISVMPLKENKPLIQPYRTQCRKELRGLLREILLEDYCSIKLKIMAIWVSAFPFSYYFVHRVYEKVTGIDKKYKPE